MSSDGARRSDEDLMRRARAGDADAFAGLYDRHGARAFRVARAICSDPDLAETAVEDGFLTIWSRRANYPEGDAGFQAWAMRIVQERAIELSAATADGSPPPPPDDDEGRTLLAALRLLSDAQAEVIVLAVFGDLTPAQIAAQLDLPAGTVEGRMRLGVRSLHRSLIAATNRRSA
jgi:RNA polymerase sigma-70 factor, ECF subfamily